MVATRPNDGASLSRDGVVKAEVEKARSLFRTGDCAGAIEFLASSRQQFGPSASGALLMSDIYSFMSDHRQALAAINDAIVLASREASALPGESAIRKAAILTALERREAAIDLLATLPLADRKAAFFRALRHAVSTKEEVAAFERVASPNFFRKDMSCVAALNHYAILLRDNGDAKASIVAARQRFLKTSDIFPFGRNAKPSVRPGWVDEAALCLADLKRELDSAGIPFFLISGTFLGAHRDGNIIGHDKDIDVGVDESVSVEDLAARFAASPRFLVKVFPTKRCVYVSHANGVSVDIFIHYMEGGRYWHEGLKVRWWNSPFELEEISFLNGTYKVPADADRYLTENYGNWRTPVPDFETFVDTPNMEVRSHEHVVWYYLTKLADYYLLGRMPQFSRVWAALEAIYSVDEELREAARLVISGENTVGRGGSNPKSPPSGAQHKPWLPHWAIGPGRFAKKLGRAAMWRQTTSANRKV